MKNKIFIIIISFLISNSFANKTLIDRVIAVVGDSVILQSELDSYIQLKISQTGEKVDSLAINMMRYKTLDEMIDGKVLLVHAEKDTNIAFSESDVDAELEGRIDFIMKKNSITLEQLKSLLLKEQNISLEKFKSTLKIQIKQEILKQKIQYFYVLSKKFSNSQITDFFNEYKDSLPSIGKSVLLSKLSYNLTPSKEVREKAYAKITKLKTLLDNGEDFDEIAKKFSEGPNAKNGGDLGYIKKGSIDELSFEKIIFSTIPGTISNIFETKLGFHIITVTDKKGLSVAVKQVFVSVTPEDNKKKEVIATFDSLATTIKTEEEFIVAIEKYSNNNLSKSQNIQKSWFAVLELDDKIKNSFSELIDGSISKTIVSDENISIYRINKVDENRKLTISDDWNTISKMAKQYYSEKVLGDLVKKWRKEIYIDNRL